MTDTRLVNRYNLFILEGLKAWIDPKQKSPKSIHHHGYGTFVVDGETIKLKSKMPRGGHSLRFKGVLTALFAMPDADDHHGLASDAELHDVSLRTGFDEQLTEIASSWHPPATFRKRSSDREAFFICV